MALARVIQLKNIFLIILFLYYKTLGYELTHPIIHTTHGKVQGVKSTSLYGDKYYSFEKIPYAQPPVGELRFKAPLPPKPWSGILSYTQLDVEPIQKNRQTGEIEGNEDCLYLNFFVKKLRSKRPLPVMVFIYGGIYQTGHAMRSLFGPDYFMHEDVILVTFNYRLNVLGFLQLQDPKLKVPGNAALKDQLLALRWVKENCQKFNGDIENITIFGESAGGSSVHYLMLTYSAVGLFHKAILQSGAIYNKWPKKDQGDYPFRLAKVNGYDGENIESNILTFLMKLNASELVNHTIRTEEEDLSFVDMDFGPTIESYRDENSIISENPHRMLKNAWANEIPIIIGGNSFEGLARYQKYTTHPEYLEAYRKNPELLVPSEVRKHKSLNESRELGEELIKLHMGDADLNVKNIFEFLKLVSYRRYWHGSYRALLSRLKYAKAQTFLYHFDFDSPTFNFYRIKSCGEKCRGVSHGDDLSYLFNMKQAWKLDKDSEEYKTIRRMISTWTAFASNSNPNNKEIGSVMWEAIMSNNPDECLNISNNVTITELPEASKLKFWNSLYRSEDLI